MDIPDPQKFLAQTWQKSAAFWRDLVPRAVEFLTSDDLRRWASDPHVESRIWKDGRVAHGPFPKPRIRKLEGEYSLLIQGAERLSPAVWRLQRSCKILPYWRMSDVMISLSSKGAGVGAHVDLYDVFLVQGQGQRKWRLGSKPLTPEEQQDCDDTGGLKLIKNPTMSQTLIMNPGDVLYVPPGIVHEGTTISDTAITYSIGYRAPSIRDMLLALAEELADELDESQLVGDPDRVLQHDPYLISTHDSDRCYNLLMDHIRSRTPRWSKSFGSLVSESSTEAAPLSEEQATSDTSWDSLSIQQVRLTKSLGIRVFHSQDPLWLFIEGNAYPITQEAFASNFCKCQMLMISSKDTLEFFDQDAHPIGKCTFDPAIESLILEALSHGWLRPELS